jgi:hypothetical protein
MDLIIKRPQVISLHLSLHVNCYLTCWSNKLGICMLQDTILKKDAEYISYRDFIHKELVHYSVSNVRRSIPSLVVDWNHHSGRFYVLLWMEAWNPKTW